MLLSIFLIPGLAESEQLSWDLAKAVIQWQSNVAVYSLTALIGVTVLIFVISWIHSSRTHKREIEEIAVSIESKLTEKMQEVITALTKEVRQEIGRLVSEVEKNMTKRMDLFNAEKARLFAIANNQLKNWDEAAGWSAEAILNYVKLSDAAWTRTNVDVMIGYLRLCEKLADDARKKIEECLPIIPEILYGEKMEITHLLKELDKKAQIQPGKN